MNISKYFVPLTIDSDIHKSDIQILKDKIRKQINIVTQGDIIAVGNVIAKNYIVSSSVTFQTQSFSSGSTIFGDTLSDTHQFTGSVDVSGSLTLNGTAVGTSVSTFDAYIRKTFVKKASTLLSNSTASFNAVTPGLRIKTA